MTPTVDASPPIREAPIRKSPIRKAIASTVFKQSLISPSIRRSPRFSKGPTTQSNEVAGCSQTCTSLELTGCPSTQSKEVTRSSIVKEKKPSKLRTSEMNLCDVDVGLGGLESYDLRSLSQP